MNKCNCGAEYKTTKPFLKHVENCSYSDLDIDVILHLGHMINEVDRTLFYANFGKLKKYAKDNKLSISEATEEMLHKTIYSYRKSLWDIHLIWQNNLLTSERRQFLQWVWKNYKDITLISLRNLLGNEKIIYRFNLENTTPTITKRINDSLIFIHEHGEIENDFEFVDLISTGKISMYYVLFNDWLASEWFGRLDKDLQDELHDYVELASKTVLERLTPKEFDELNKLACSESPIIYDVF